MRLPDALGCRLRVSSEPKIRPGPGVRFFFDHPASVLCMVIMSYLDPGSISHRVQNRRNAGLGVSAASGLQVRAPVEK